MSCGVALAVTLLLSDPNVALAAAQPPAAAEAPVSVAAEPLFADIVARSDALRGVVRGWIEAGVMDQADFAAGSAFAGFRTRAAELAALDMQGHVILKDRGTDGDLKCILRGIAEDMPLKVAAVEAAATPAERREALDDLAYLLDDNAAVITAPPQPEV
ncbi:MAG: hypothetical protein Q8O54_12885 [Brevundimonas sp.]|nr:hypothetical protein [Brevundimonas sp.]